MHHLARRRRPTLAAGILSGLLGLGAVLLVASPASAATVTVTSPADSGPGSLRAAVAAASTGDTIGFGPAVTAIALASTITLPLGITIDGGGDVVLSPASGVTALTIAPTAAAQDYLVEGLELSGTANTRAIMVQAGSNLAHDVTLSDLIVHGFTNTDGSGIDVTAVAGTVTIDSSTLSGNTATGVGGSAVRYTAPSGVAFVISNTTVSGNQTTPTDVVGDGAISVEGSPAASITLRSDAFSGNQAGGPAPPPYNLIMGAAVSLGNDDGSSGPLTVVDTTFTANGLRDATHGNVYIAGGLHASRAASVTVTDTVFQGNASRDLGSSFVFDNTSGPIALTRITVNGGSFHDGGGTGVGGGFFANNTGTTTITGLTASGNSGGDGSVLEIQNQSGAFTVTGGDIVANSSETGAIYFESINSAVQIGTSTFRQNSSTGAGAADVTAGSIATAASLTIDRSTFSEGTSTGGGGVGLAVHVPTAAGAMTISQSTFEETAAVPVIRVATVNGTFALTNSTIVSGLGVSLGVINGTLARVSHTVVQVPSPAAALTVGAAGSGPDLDVRWSLLSSALAAHQTDSGGNRLNADAQLAALANNGGPTQTMLPQTGSAAIDAGDPAFSGALTDQRGLPRIVGIIDIGAVEVQPIGAPTLSATGVPVDGGLHAAIALLLLGTCAVGTRAVRARRRLS